MITGNFPGCGGSPVEGSNAAAFCRGAFSCPLGTPEALTEGLSGKAGLKAEHLSVLGGLCKEMLAVGTCFAVLNDHVQRVQVYALALDHVKWDLSHLR